MAHTVIGVFDNASEAQRAVELLVSKGFSRDDIDVSSQRSSYSGSAGSASGSDYPAGTSGLTTAADTSTETAGSMGYPLSGSDRKESSSDHGESGITRFFKSLFGNDDEADKYSTVANRSDSIVTVHARTSDEAEDAADILDDAGAVDVDERASQYGYGTSASSTGVTGVGLGDNISALGTASTGVGDTGKASSSKDFEDEASRSIPIIEEQLEVGKRTVQTGGARLRSRIIERPVEESLRLRQERVRVERNTVDRPATEADFDAFKEGTIELTEHAEVPVVSKEARVVEEVSLQKDIEERKETIKDTVRRTEVDVEDLEKNKDVSGNM